MQYMYWPQSAADEMPPHLRMAFECWEPVALHGKPTATFKPLTMQGEEGIDAGGVTREWYMVMAREVFNPNLALFVQVRVMLACGGV